MLLGGWMEGRVVEHEDEAKEGVGQLGSYNIPIFNQPADPILIRCRLNFSNSDVLKVETNC